MTGADTAGQRSHNRILQLMASMAVLQGAAMVFGLVKSKTVALLLGPSGVGLIGLIDQLTVLVAQASAFSLPVAAVTYLSAAHSENHASFSRLYAAFWRTLLACSGIGSLLVLAAVLITPEVLSGQIAPYRGVAVLALLAAPALNLIMLVTNTMAAAQRPGASAIYGAFNVMLAAVCCAVGVVVAGIFGYYLGALLASFAITAAGAAWLWRNLRLRTSWPGLRFWNGLRSEPGIIGFSLAMYVTSFVSPLSDLLVRYAVLQAGGLHLTGLFQAASGIAIILRTTTRTSFSLFLAPVLNRKTPVLEKLAEVHAFVRVLAVWIGVPGLAIVLAPDVFTLVLYSRDFRAVAPTIYLFLTGVSIQLFAAVTLALLVALADMKAFLWASIAADLGTALLAWVLAPRYGLTGVAAAFIADGLLQLAVAAWWLAVKHGVSAARIFGGMPLGVAGALVAVGAVSVQWLGTDPQILAIKACVWLVCAVFLYQLLRGTRRVG